MSATNEMATTLIFFRKKTSQMYDNANGENVKRREILKEGEKDMYLTVVLKSKTLKTEIDFSNKKECYEFAEGLMEK